MPAFRCTMTRRGRTNVKQATAKKMTTAKARSFVVVKRASSVYINGNRVLDPMGKPSVSMKKLRAAVREVAKAKQ